MLFRAADKQQVNQITVDEFRILLQKLKLGLTGSQISRIVYICDEDCSGTIRKDEFYDCLAAYEVNQEKSSAGNRTFGQQSLIKLASILIRKLTPEMAFKKMDYSGKNYITFE